MFWQPWSEDALQPPGFFLPPNFRNQCWEISLKKGEMTWRTVGRVCSLVCFDKLRNLSTPLQKMYLADETKHWWFNDCFKFTEIARIITRKRLSNWDLENTVTDLERRITGQRSTHRKIQVSLKIHQRKMVLYQSPNRYVSFSNYVLDTKQFRADSRLDIIWGQEIRQNLLPLS